MDHIVIPLDEDHVTAVGRLAGGAAEAAGVDLAGSPSIAHVTMLAYAGVARETAMQAVEPVVTAMAPFAVHAHGFGFFTGADPTDISLHVQVVRSAGFDELHRSLWEALRAAGAVVANWSGPDLWSPHITLLDRSLDPARLGAAAEWLARRHHPSWRINVDQVVLTGGWPDHERSGAAVRLGYTPP